MTTGCGADPDQRDSIRECPSIRRIHLQLWKVSGRVFAAALLPTDAFAETAP